MDDFKPLVDDSNNDDLKNRIPFLADTINVQEYYSLEDHRRKIYTWNNINWFSAGVLLLLPIISVYGILTTPFHKYTLIWSISYYFFTGLGITAGYHRYWSHRSYDATFLLRIILMIAGTGAVEGSIKWWSRHHRAHHRYTDTRLDPYATQHGFWHSHMLWMMFKEHPEDRGKVSVDDIKQDLVANFQHRHYFILMLVFGFIVPTLVAGYFWNDYLGGYFYAGVTRLLFVHHATFCVNSLAHWLGEASFDDRYTPKDHIITALVTLGEGYHNFHHEFPNDFRNAIEFWQYDPTKWIIKIFELIGLASNLRTFPTNEIEKGKLAMKEKKIQKLKEKLNYGPPLETLKTITINEFKRLVKQDKKKLLIIEEIIYDVEGFIDHHPGGTMFIKSGIGRDVTTSFNGGIYNHHLAARNLLQSMRYAIVDQTQHKIPEDIIAKEE